MEWLYQYAPVLSFLTAFGITYFFIPAIIKLSLSKRLFDVPEGRKEHQRPTSSLGGMGIFGGLLISYLFYSAPLANPATHSVLVGIFILFFTGIKDDLHALPPYQKLIGQSLAVVIVIFQGDIRLVSFYGVMGIDALPYWLSVVVSFVFILAIVNSFNFIDGINGLVSSIGLLVSLVYAIWFYFYNDLQFLILALSIAGAQIAFLRFNLFKAKIFMGDSGSMMLGFFAAILTINYLKINQAATDPLMLDIDSMLFALAVLIVPIVDTFRVIFIRMIILKRPPFYADRNHLHHALLDIGLNHSQATGILVLVNLIFIVATFFLNPIVPARYLGLVVIVSAIVLSQIPFLIKQKNKKLGKISASKN